MITRDREYGIGSHTRCLCKYLRKNGIEVDELYGGGNLRTNILPFFKDLRKYDIIHSQGSPFCIMETDIPKITTVHTLIKKEREFEDNLSFRIGEQFEKKTLNSSDKIIVVNDFLKDELQKYYEISGSRVCVIPNGIDFSEFLDKEKVRGRFVLTGGRDIKRKNLQEVRDICIELRINLIEFGTSKYVPRSELLELYRTAMCFISSSVYETGSLTVMEAMASRCPVIYRDAEFANNLIGEDGIRYFTEVRFKKELSFLKKYGYNYSFSSDMLDRAYDKVKDKYDWSVLVKRVINVYDEVLM